jgi:hypothetical protein
LCIEPILLAEVLALCVEPIPLAEVLALCVEPIPLAEVLALCVEQGQSRMGNSETLVQVRHKTEQRQTNEKTQRRKLKHDIKSHKKH